MEAHDELERLLADLLDGPPDASRNQRLANLLHAHPELQGEYLDYLQIHGLLQWRAGKITPPESVPIEKPAPEPAAPGRHSAPWFSRGKAIAGLLLLAACVAALFLLRIPEARATPDLMTRLADWNLEITEAPRNERNRIYLDQAANLQASLATAELPSEDRKLAETLLAGASLLAQKDDPMAEADYFNGVADLVVSRMEAATIAGDKERIVQLADIYSRLTEVGLNANLDKARAAGRLDADKDGKFKRISMHRTRRLTEIIERNPEPSRKAIHRAMKKHHKKNKH